jgi:hypothetical protein
MGTPQTPKRRKSSWARYGPFIAIVAVVVIVAVIIGSTMGGDDDGDDGQVEVDDVSSGLPVLYSDAKADGALDDYTWQEHCDTETGRVAIATNNPLPCVPQFSGDNGGATSPGVTADTVRVGYYMAKPDPQLDALAKAAGAYDPPANVEQSYKDYTEIFNNIFELYGRKIELVRIDGTGTGTDEVAARADAKKAAEANLFAVMGGPAQAKSWSEELAANKVLCIGTCIVAQPEQYFRDNSPYLWPTTPSPDQTSTHVVEFIQKQLAGKKAEYAGSPELRDKERTFALLTYDTPDGQFKASWDDLKQKMEDAGVDVVDHINYYLDLAQIQADARTIATKLKQTGATSIVFTGDPLLPRFFTREATAQGYFPEWVMSGTVFADTNVFARTFDQQQWAHAFGLQLIPARLPTEMQESYVVNQWWFGKAPAAENAHGVVFGNVQTVFSGLQLAGADLTPETFRDGMYNGPPQVDPGEPALSTIVTFGDHGFWQGTDYNALDNSGLMYWDPTAEGQDETGTQGQGMYRLVDGGVRYLPGNWPTEPIKLFDPTNTVTIYDAADVPAELRAQDVPVPPNAPAAQK